MSNLVPLNQMQVPAHLQQNMSREQIAAMNAAAALGTGGGGINKISLKQSRFRLVVGGVETMVIPQLAIQLVVVRVNDGVNKTFYVQEYNPNEEGQNPDCSSDDGIRPRADSPNPQHHECETCPQNQWGSKISRMSGAKIKACQDSKRMAVIAPDNTGSFANGGDLYQLAIPPASLPEFGGFVRTLGSLPVPVGYNAVVAEVAFDTTVSYPKLLFKPVRYLDQAEFDAIQRRYDEPETKHVAGLAVAQTQRLTGTTAGVVQQPQTAVQQPVQQQVQQPVQQAPVQQAQQQPVQQQAQVQQTQQAAAGGWGEPQPTAQVQTQQPQTQAAAGWGEPQPTAQAQQQTQVQQQPQQQVQQQAQVQQQPGVAYHPSGRQVGKPSAGKSRRNSAEVAEDDAYMAAQNGQPAPVQPVQVTTGQQVVQQVQTQQSQQAAGGWGEPQPTAQAQQQAQQPQTQAPAAAGWGEPQPAAQVQQVQTPAQAPAFDANNPWAGAGAPQTQAPVTGAPNQPGVVADAGGAFGGWDDPAPAGGAAPQGNGWGQ